MIFILEHFALQEFITWVSRDSWIIQGEPKGAQELKGAQKLKGAQ